MDGICRTCLSRKSEKMHYLYSSNISQILGKFTHLQFNPDDELSDCICDVCIKKLKKITEFKERCVVADMLQRKGLKTIKEKQKEDAKKNDIIAAEVFKLNELIFPQRVLNELRDKDGDRNDNHDKNKNNKKDDIIVYSDYQNSAKTISPKKMPRINSSRLKKFTNNLTKAFKPAPFKSTLPFRCKICNQGFLRQERLDEHLLCKHPKTKSFGCEVCKRDFTSLPAMKKHTQNVHDPSMKHVCPCGKKFMYETGLKTHMESHIRTPCVYICEKCGKTFPTKKQLTQHSLVHTTENQFVCNLCNKRFKSLYLLQCHKHSEIHNFTCPKCGKTVSTKAELKSHMLIHEELKQFKCSVCDKRFHHKVELTQHLKVHIGEKTFKCETCKRCYTSRNSLNLHKRIHCGSRPFVCPVCKKGFAQLGLLKRHKKTHHVDAFSHICPVCKKGFNELSALILHKKKVHPKM